jgi:hypothetical protein
VFVLLTHLSKVVVVDVVVVVVVVVNVVVVSHPLHVLSHSPGTLEHKPCAKIVWHFANDNLLCLPAQRCGLAVVLVEVVLVDVVVVVVSQPVHVLAHCVEKELHRSAANNSWHLAKGNVFLLFAHLSVVVVVLVDVLVDVDDVVDVDDDDVDDVVVDDVVYVEDVLVVVVSHPLQVLAQCVIFATLLSHKPCN